MDPNFFAEGWSTVLLSLRDLRRDVPINYNQYPGIALTPACFSDRKYTGDKSPCIENLIAIGYRRFVIDLYLDKDHGSWDVCPSSKIVESLATNRSVSQLLPIAGTTESLSSSTTLATLLARQTPTLLPEELGEYKCDDSFNTTTFFLIFESWITNTDTDLGARILLFNFNLHETSPPSDNMNPPAPESLMDFERNYIFPDIYTPSELALDRSDLSSSWFGERVDANTSEYFNVQLNSRGIRSTEDGWPSEWYLEFIIRKRALASFGTIEEGLGYDPIATGDTSYIFPAGYLGEPVTLDNSAVPECFFSNSSFELKEVNSSWAQVVDTTSNAFPGNRPGTVTDLASCGYSTTLNSTYSANATANVTANTEHYFAHIKDALAWSWDANEPMNNTTETSENTFRCASMSAGDGRWRVTECGERKLAACRIGKRPYDVWSLTSHDSTYYDAAATCDDNDFDAPRTALENTYLLATIRKAQLKPDDRIWIDFNSIAAMACWVTGGENSPCPYQPRDFKNKQVIVSSVAAVIVLIVFGLMWFVKVGSWRVERSRRRRRKMAKKRNLEGVEYEGVPS